ncbi:hypothetical protein XI06_21590 [Bradyrhizobium sp. CCBAU 11434]|nr:hypothetical protein [Bradyrhizobium sp. CCBAU 11434]
MTRLLQQLSQFAKPTVIHFDGNRLWRWASVKGSTRRCLDEAIVLFGDVIKPAMGIYRAELPHLSQVLLEHRLRFFGLFNRGT